MTDATTSETPNTRLAKLIEDLGSTDTAIAKAIAIVTGKSISKTSVATHMPDGGNKKIKPEFITNIGDSLPFLNTSWLESGNGKMLKDWSSKQQNDFVLKSKWYKDKPKKSEEFHQQSVAGLIPKAQDIVRQNAKWDSQ